MATVSIPLTQGKFALIDEEDFLLVGHLRWHVSNGYAYNRMGRIAMHRLVMGAAPEQIVDHINGNTLDNRRCNLRFATRSTNAANGQRNKGGSSKFKGVHFYKRDSRWTAQIKKDYKRIHLGYFDNEEDAARAYDEAAVALFGEYALVNFPDRLGEAPPSSRVPLQYIKESPNGRA